MMETSDLAVLAMVATGMLTIDTEGRVWRHREITRGSKVGGREVSCRTRRADTGRSEKNGYRRVQVTIGKERFAAPAHRIVWMVANQRMIPPGMEPNHINGVKDDNRPENLELVTRTDNVLHALHDLGRYRTRQGKLTPDQVVAIRHLRDNGWASRAAVAEQFGISTVMVKKIEQRVSWKWVPESAG